jgi:spore coat protein H
MLRLSVPPHVGLLALALSVALPACGDEHITQVLCEDAGTAVVAAQDAGPSAPSTSTGDAGSSPAQVKAPTSAAPTTSDAADKPVPKVQGPDLFPMDRAIDVKVTLPEADFEVLRREGRSMNDLLINCPQTAFSYSQHRADVEIAGVNVASVGVAKKGFLGSLSVYKPSLRLELDAYAEDQELSNTSDVTLNNSFSDKSLVRQCLAYGLFTKSGIPAPRCGFAHVSINGRDLGTYVNVEPVKKPFLKAHFSSGKGDLYEGAMADFRTDFLNGFEKKTNQATPVSPLLAGLAAALDKDDQSFLAELPTFLDLDAFLKFWAMESLLGHWDGYAGDLNNFFLYIDPGTNKLTFLPWGPDLTFQTGNLLAGTDKKLPVSVQATARLARRLYGMPGTRARYQATLRMLLTTVWDEPTILAEIDRLAAIAGSGADATSLESVRNFVRERKAAILAELDAPTAPEWPAPERTPNICRPELTSAISGTFETTWGDLNGLSLNLGNSVTGNIQGKPIPTDVLVSSAGLYTPGDYKAVRLAAVNIDGSLTVLQFMLGSPTLAPGVYPMHGFETFGILLTGPALESISVAGFIGDGHLVLEEASTEAGSVLKGRFDGKLAAVVRPIGGD